MKRYTIVYQFHDGPIVEWCDTLEEVRESLSDRLHLTAESACLVEYPRGFEPLVEGTWDDVIDWVNRKLELIEEGAVKE